MKSKKYFLALGLGLVMMTAVVANFMVSESETQMDALALANVEALANGEEYANICGWSPYYTCRWSPYEISYNYIKAY